MEAQIIHHGLLHDIEKKLHIKGYFSSIKTIINKSTSYIEDLNMNEGKYLENKNSMVYFKSSGAL